MSVDGATVTYTTTAPEPMLDAVEKRLVGDFNPVVSQAVRVSHGALRSYGTRSDYDTDPIEESFTGVDVSRSGDTLTITWGWDHPAAIYFNNGTSDHTINGNPVLAFEFDAAEYPHLDEMFPDGTAFLPSVEVSGLPQSRFVQAGLNWLRQELE